MVRARNDGEQGKRCGLAGQSGPKSFHVQKKGENSSFFIFLPNFFFEIIFLESFCDVFHRATLI